MKISLIDKSKAEQVAKLAVCLTNEIIERTGVKYFNVDSSLAIKLCQDFIAQGHYHVIAAQDGDTLVGFGALCESRSLYAEGCFGILQEFYVLPDYRSQGIGKALLEEIAQFAKQQDWRRLELCTPPVPEFEATVAFYQTNGFEITGGYKMKRVIR